MNRLSVKKGRLVSEVDVPSSKSYANRALILAAIQKNPYQLVDLPVATDVTILIDCLKKIGLEIEPQSKNLTMVNSFPECECADQTLDVGEGGTTARFLAALLLMGQKTYKLQLGERLRQRPWADFIHVARSLGASAELNSGVLTLRGPITFPELLEIDCSETTQFATAFQLIAPSHCRVIPNNLIASESYWKMTAEIIKRISSSLTYVIPKDWSSASYPMAFAALNQEIFFPQLQMDQFQADSKFVEILKNYNSIIELDNGFKVRPSLFTGDLAFDVSDCLDLVPTLAYFLAHIKGEHHLIGVDNLIHKESNRLEQVVLLLSKFERKSLTDGTNLRIYGHTEIVNRDIILDVPNDHRMVMAGTLFLLHHHGGTVSPASAVTKSYPRFFDLLDESI